MNRIVENRTSALSEKEFKEKLGNILRIKRESLNLSRNSASKSIGVSNSTLQAWEESGDRTPNSWDLIKICNAYNTSINELFELFQSKNADLNHNKNNIIDSAGNIIDLAEFSFIPQYNITTNSRYSPNIGPETYIFSIAYRNCWIRNHLNADPKDLIAITIQSDSMINLIDEKDTILIDKSMTYLSDGIYLLRIEKDLMVRRVQKLLNNTIEISSANSAYKPIQIDLNKLPKDFCVIGSVVHVESGTQFRSRKY